MPRIGGRRGPRRRMGARSLFRRRHKHHSDHSNDNQSGGDTESGGEPWQLGRFLIIMIIVIGILAFFFLFR